MADNALYQSSAPATPPAGFVVRTEEVATGAGSATAHVQVMRLGAAAAGSSEIVSTAFPLPVRLQDSTALVSIQGNTSAVLSTGSTGRVELSSGGLGGVSGNAIWVQPTTTVPVSLTSGSKVQVEPGAGAAFPISGNTTAIVGNSSGAFSTANPLPVLLQSSTATVTVQGNVSAAVAGNVSAVISGNATAVLSNTSGNITTGNPLAVYIQGSTATVTVQGNVSAAISGNTTAIIGNSSGAFSTANPLPVLLQSSTATVTIQGNATVAGNVTAILTTGSKLQVEPVAGAVFPISGNATIGGNVSAIVTALPGTVQIGTTGGSTALLMAGADGGTSNATARTLNVNASRELLITGAVTISGNATVAGNVSAVISGNATAVLSNTSGNITTANPLAVFLQGSTATVTVQGNVSAAISGNTTAIIGNSSGAFSTANPLPVLLQSSTATVTIQGNASVAVTALPGTVTPGNAAGTTALLLAGQDSNSTARVLRTNASGELQVGIVGNASVQGNVSAVISGNATAVLSNTSGNITTANPLAIFLQGSTATVSIQGNATVAGNVTALLTTGSKVQVEPVAGAVFPISGNATVAGNVSAVVTAIPGAVTLVGAAGTTGLLVYGADTTGAGATVRPLKVNASGELVVQTGAIAIGGLAQINTTGGSTMMIVGGMDGGTSNSTARALRVNSSGELLTVGGSVTVAGAGIINTTAGSSGLLVLGADGNTTNSTARYLQVNASQELIVKGTIVGNTSVVGNVSAVISGNATAVLSNTSGNIASGNPLHVFLQDSTATVTVQGNTTAIVTTGSKLQVEPIAGAVFPISGNATVAGNVSAVITGMPGIAQINTTGGSTMMLVGGHDGGTSNSTARTLNVNASRELLITGPVTISGNATVAGNVSAVISGNATAVLSNTSGNITTANPLAVYMQGSTATVTIAGNATVAGNVTAILTTGSVVRAELTTGGMGGTTANPVFVADAQRLRQFYDGNTLVTVANASINVTASGIFSIVVSGTGAILVLNTQFSAISSCTIQWLEATTSGITGVQSLVAGGGFVLPFSPAGWFQTTTGKQLSLSVQGSTGGVGGSLTYARVAG